MDYQLPRAEDLPSFTVDMTVTPCPSNPLGVKGCGEAGAIAAPAAVINAVTDALGHEDIAMPATPQAVWRAAQRTTCAWRRSNNQCHPRACPGDLDRKGTVLPIGMAGTSPT